MTPGQRWRRKRDLTLYVAWRSGLSQRYLADVFDLARSRVARVLRTFPDDPERGRARPVAPSDGSRAWVASELRKVAGSR